MSPERPVLILAPDQDRLARAAHDELARRGVQALRVDQADLPSGWDLGWSVVSRVGFAGPPGRRVELQDLRSVLVRPGGRHVPDAGADDEQSYIQEEIAASILGLLAGLDCPVVNRPVPGGVGRLIVRESAVLAASALEPTPMLMTSDREAALAFYRDHCNRRAMVAPATADTPPELIEGEDAEASLAARASSPIVLQAMPEGTSESVWVVGERSVCVNGVAPSVLDACAQAARGLGLELARFDLVTVSEQAACVEISPMPDLPDDTHACGELLHALCDLLATGSVAS
jgi:hypothetical protein